MERRTKAPSHGGAGATDFDLASLPSRRPLECSHLSWLLIRQLVPFYILHSTFDILCSMFGGSNSSERRRLVDGFAALGPLC
jgi:hypothetical protein